MSGNIGNLLKNKNDGRAQKRMKHAKGLLKLSSLLGLMLACSPAYASTLYTSAKVDVLSDSVISWGIGIFVVIIAMFIGYIIYDAKKNGRYE